MLIRSLASNYLKRTLRSPFGTWILGGSLLAVLCLWVPVFLYAFFIGFSAVRYLEIDRSVDLLASVNPAILPVLIAWGLFDGLLLGRKIYVPLFPYLITPTPRRTLALFRQIVTLFGKFNLFMLSLIAGFWVKNLYLQDIAFDWNWLLLLCLLCVCIHFAANILRSWRGEKYLPVLGVLLCVSALAVLEWGHDVRILSGASATLFDAAAGGAVWPSILLAGLAGCLFYGSTKRISRSLYIDHSAVPRLFRGKRRAPRRRSRPRTLTAELLSCEWKLILRNRQPRSMLMMVIIAVSFFALMMVGLSTEIDIKEVPENFNIVVILSISIAGLYLNYCFGWKSCFYDGLQSRAISEIVLLKTMILMSQRWTLLIVSICVAATIIFDIALDGMIYPDWIFVMGSVLYSMGIFNFIMLLPVILFLPVPCNPNAGMFAFSTLIQISVINPQSCVLMLMAIFYGIPLVFTLFVPGLWLGLTLGTLGLAGLCLQPWLTRLLARHLRTRRYVVMERFRIR